VAIGTNDLNKMRGLPKERIDTLLKELSDDWQKMWDVLEAQCLVVAIGTVLPIAWWWDDETLPVPQHKILVRMNGRILKHYLETKDKCHAYLVMPNISNALAMANGQLWTYYDRNAKERRPRYEYDLLHWDRRAQLYAIDLIRSSLRFAPLSPSDPRPPPPPPPEQPNDDEEDPAIISHGPAIPSSSSSSVQSTSSTSSRPVTTAGKDAIVAPPKDLRDNIRKKERVKKFGSVDGTVPPLILPPALRNSSKQARQRGSQHHVGDRAQKRPLDPEPPITGICKNTRYEGNFCPK